MRRVARSARIAAVAALALAAGAPARAQEAEAVPVAVLPYAPLYGEFPQSAGDKTAEFIANELGAGKQFSVAEVREPGARGKPREKKAGDEEIEAAKKDVAAAVEQFGRAAALAKSKKMKPAADAYEKGLQQFLLSFHGADTFQPLSDAYLQLSIVRFKLGMEDEAYRLLEDLIRIDPSRVLKPEEVAPVFARIHEKYRAAWLAKDRGQVRVGSVPAGARVTLDGRDLGETPLLARDVLPGEHYVRVVKPGQGAWWKKVKVVGGEEVSLTADLAGEATGPLATIAKALAANAFDDRIVTALREVGDASKAKIVVFGGIHKSDDGIAVKSYAVKVDDGKLAQLADLSFDLEMVGAAIEVFKLASDLGEKAAEFPAMGPGLPATLFDGAKPPSETETVAEVRVTPPDGRAPTAAEPGAEETGGRKRRVVVSAGSESRKPVTPEVEEKPPEDAPLAPVGLRPRKKIGDGDVPPPQPERKAEPEEEEAPRRMDLRAGPRGNEPRTEVKVEPKEEPRADKKAPPAPPADALKESLAEEDKPAEEPKPADLEPKSVPSRQLSGLSPEELARLESLDEGRKGRTGKVLLWTGAGVLGAAGVATVVYFLLAPSTPTSAEAHISWTP